MKIDITARIISYRGKLNSVEDVHTLSTLLYYAVKSHYTNTQINSRSVYFKWIHNIKSTLYNFGFSGIWDNHRFPNQIWLSKAVRQNVYDVFITDWHQNVESNVNYRIFKHKFEFERYLINIPNNVLYYFISIRTRNHRLPVETVRWSKLEITDRKCNLCQADVGDEYHYLLVCEKLKEQRKEFLKVFYYKRPNTIKYEMLMNTKNRQILTSVSKFIKIIYEVIKQT